MVVAAVAVVVVVVDVVGDPVTNSESCFSIALSGPLKCQVPIGGMEVVVSAEVVSDVPNQLMVALNHSVTISCNVVVLSTSVVVLNNSVGEYSVVVEILVAAVVVTSVVVVVVEGELYSSRIRF